MISAILAKQTIFVSGRKIINRPNFYHGSMSIDVSTTGLNKNAAQISRRYNCILRDLLASDSLVEDDLGSFSLSTYTLHAIAKDEMARW